VSHTDPEQIIKHLTAQGHRAVLPGEWTPQLALDVLRENRRRYANDPCTQMLGQLGGKLADDLAADTGVAPADITNVLLAASSLIAGPALYYHLSGVVVTDLLGYAADELDQRANGGERT
jgi:3-oxoacyl-[acyl-carrier-protein] synthase III